jgi:hypothetical protein
MTQVTSQDVEYNLDNNGQIIITNSEACKTNQCACLNMF